MKIEIEENEIKEAILDYVAKQGFSVDPAIAEVDIKNARGDFGVTATISVQKAAEGTAPAEPKKVTPIKKDKAPATAKEIADSVKPDEEKEEPASNKPLFS